MKCIEDEIPFELPEGWAWERMQNLTCKIGAGSTPTGGNSVYSQSGIKFIRSQNVYEDGLILDDIAYISEEINKKKSGSIVKPKDILLNITGGSIGRCALVPDDFDIGNVNQHVLIVRLVNLELRSYIHLLITSPYIQKQICDKQVGSGRGGLSATTFSSFLMPIPPENEQSKIQGFVSNILEKVISINTEKLSLKELIDKSKAQILDLAIRGKLVPQNPNDEPASVLLERIRAEKEELIKAGKIKRDNKESIIFRGEDNSYYQQTGTLIENINDWNLDDIPINWELCCLGEICDYGNCVNVDTRDIDEEAWVLDLEDIEKDSGKVIHKIRKYERDSSSTKHLFKKGQVLYSKLRPYLNKVVLADEKGFCTSEILPLNFSNVVEPKYALYYLMSPTFLKYANRCSYGVKMPRLGTADGRKAVFPLPPFEEQRRISQHISKIFMEIDDISNMLI